MIYTLTLNPALDRELTVPELAFDQVLRASALRVDYGGKGFNVSRALAALGEKSVAVGLVGGLTGQRIARGLAELGIHTDFVPISGETRTNISIVSQSQPHHLKVNEAGPTITPAEQAALLQKIQGLAQTGDWWVLSGSLPPGVAATIYAEIIGLAQAAGAQALLDTSGPPLRYGCEAGPFLAKPNTVEASELTGKPVASPQEAQAALASIHALGVRNILLSRGKAGALLSTGEQIWLAEPPRIEERNPIGAGDAALAGLVWGLSHRLSWPETLRWSVACGAATASLAGTAVGPKALVERFVGQVEVVAVPAVTVQVQRTSLASANVAT
jgi:1-phosphofructokinase family hexose kinase